MLPAVALGGPTPAGGSPRYPQREPGLSRGAAAPHGPSVSCGPHPERLGDGPGVAFSCAVEGALSMAARLSWTDLPPASLADSRVRPEWRASMAVRPGRSGDDAGAANFFDRKPA